MSEEENNYLEIEDPQEDLDEYLSDNESLDENDGGPVTTFKSSQLKNNKIALNGYLFVLNKELKGRFYWLCDQYRTSHCTARLISIRNEGIHEVVKNSAHNHSSSSHRVVVEQAKSSLREIAKNDFNGTPAQNVDEIKRSEMVRVNKISSIMGSTESLRKIARRVKKKYSTIIYPKSPTTFNFTYDMNFEPLQIDNESLLLFDYTSPDRKDRITIFTKDSLFDQFCLSDLLVLDGTFQTCPLPYKQLFIIHGNITGFDNYFTYPMIWILMSGKKETLYIRALNEIRDYAINRGKMINARFSMCDFEPAIRNSLRQVFPAIDSRACFFHLRQIVITQLRKLKLYKKYMLNPNFAYEINMIVALAYFPPLEIEELFEELYGILSEDARTFCDWFQINYIRKPDGRDARNPPTFWSIYDLTRLGFPKTQCGAEQSHHSLFLSCNKVQHLPLYKMINVLNGEMIKSDQAIEKVRAGIMEKHRSKFYENKESLIQTILDDKDEPNRPLLDSLRGIATALCSINHLLLLFPE